MAAITSDENDPQPLTSHVQGDGAETPAKQMRQARISPVHKQLAGAFAVLVVFIASLAIWGAGMEFPTTVSSSEVATTGAGSVTADQDVPGRHQRGHQRRCQMGNQGGQLALRRSEDRYYLCPAIH